MLHPSAYLAYAAWLVPIVLPFLFAIAWRQRLRQKAAFVIVGVLCACGVIFLSAFPLGLLLGWLNRLFGLSLRGPAYGGVPALIWFNGISMFVLNVAMSVLASFVLARLMRPRGGGNAASIGTRTAAR